MKHKRLQALVSAAAMLAGWGAVLSPPWRQHGPCRAVVHLSYTLWDTNEEIGYKHSLAVFEKSHPNISVTIRADPYAAYQTKLQEEFSSGSGPDIFWINTPWLSTWIKDGFMVNLTPYIKKAGINLAYIPSLVALHEYKGALYGLPKDWDTIGTITTRPIWPRTT